MDAAAFEANNGVVVTDPLTGELRLAGQFSGDEWRKMAKANPDLATALIDLRQAKSDETKARESARRLLSMAGARLAVSPAMKIWGEPALYDKAADVLDWHQGTMAAPQTTIYESPTTRLRVGEAPGVIELENLTDAPLSVGELNKARTAFGNYRQSPEGRKLFVATPTGDKVTQKARIYESLGFRYDPAGYMRFDNRPGAQEFGQLYNLGDKVAETAALYPETTKRVLRIGGGLGATLAGAALINSAWGFINPLEDY